MSLDVYSAGQITYPSGRFEAAPAMPAISSVTVTAVIQNPLGVEANLPLGSVTIVGQVATVTATGFIIPDVAASAGWWWVRFKATVDIVDTDEKGFWVKRSYVLA